MLTAFCLRCYFKDRRRELANSNVGVWVCRGVCVSEAQPEDGGAGSHPAHLEVVLLALPARKDLGALGAKMTQPGRNETRWSIRMETWLVAEQRNQNNPF